ncbi:APC family permease [Curtobacterium caseinilyticum]|uniref:APC family permease n=1 Tax=Curtobacterium caseinilyticum TaxID=3055137 RepID=A0ABT7TRV5_9MICO|nr:APC family permease [Curtobacterium caseinilyticum]MDM7892343.1 APC family permease [Curtobacterium caseinilyticum]
MTDRTGIARTTPKGLQPGSIGLLGSIVVGLSSTAPAYSLAASLGLVVASGGVLLAGVKAPSILLLAFVPVWMIAVAYRELNRVDPDCGTTFTWVTRAFGPVPGWLGGWGIIAADVIVMANLAQVAGSYGFTFVGALADDATVAALGHDRLWSTVAGVAWIAVMTVVCHLGVEVSTRLQVVLLSIEVLALVVFAGVAAVRVAGGTGTAASITPTLAWFWPSGLDLGSVVAPAMLTAIFIYWGWDTAVSLNEETRDPTRTPGRAAVVSTVLLLGIYVLVATATIAFAGVGVDGTGLGAPANAEDVFAAIAPVLFGSSALGHAATALLAFAILTSAAASTQTTIMPTARTALAMAAQGALPSRFARVHERHRTPTWSTWAMGLASAGCYVLLTVLSADLLSALIESVGLMIAFTYALTGFACVWVFRRTLLDSARHLVVRGIVPFLGGTALTLAFVHGLAQFARPDWLQDADGRNVTVFGIGAVAVVGVGSIAVGVVLMVAQRFRSPAFFTGRTLVPRSDPDVAGTPEPERDVRR